ncbi:MAG: hypothetical protein HKN29_06385 [Rhodothermales bacterium]|nr:hypothetical protein [Rhodothermales bacterium]
MEHLRIAHAPLMRLFLLIAGLAVFLPVAPVLGQVLPDSSIAEPYETIEASLGISFPGDQGVLGSAWDPGIGVLASAATPFYTGRLTGLVRMRPYSANADAPSFRAFSVHVGWDRPLVSVGRATLRGGFSLGTMRMSFDDNSEPGIRNESEFSVALSGSVVIRASGESAILIGFSRERIFTSLPVDAGQWSVAYAHQFRTPDWIRRVIE